MSEGITRKQALMYLVSRNPLGYVRAAGFSEEEILEARLANAEARRREWEERMSPDWRGEEMGT